MTSHYDDDQQPLHQYPPPGLGFGRGFGLGFGLLAMFLIHICRTVSPGLRQK
jgi:hypothetical protein